MKKKNNYFLMMAEMTNYCKMASDSLNDTMRNLNSESLKKGMLDLKSIEHNADEAKHDLVNKLLTEFITPIEREDILRLSDCIDDVTDNIENILLNIYMYHIDEIIPQAYPFLDLLDKTCIQLCMVMNEFSSLHKSKTLKDLLIKLDGFESEGDVLYTETIRGLYENPTEKSLKVLAWEKIFYCYEKCFDCCEDIAKVVENIIITNH